MPRQKTMRSVTVIPCHPNTVDLIESPMPNLHSIPEERGVLVKVLQVCLCGTDRELCLGKYGNPPDGSDYLIIGHESLGKVTQVGLNVKEFVRGDYVVATVRRPGNSVYDYIGTCDMTTENDCYERGINFLHGFLTEYYVERPDCLIKIPPVLKDVAVLLEPMSVVQKGIDQVYEIQRRLKVWQPGKAAVVGIGSIGLLATLSLRLRNIETVCFDILPKPNLKATLVEEIGARYLDTSKTSLKEANRSIGPFDLIFEASGQSLMAFESAHTLAKNGILAVFSIPNEDCEIKIASDRLIREFVLGNKVMFGIVNARRKHFESGVADFAQSEMRWPGWLSRLLTHTVQGLENYKEAFSELFEFKDVIKVKIDVAKD